MTSLAAILADNADVSVERAQAHLTLLRVFCAVYDSLAPSTDDRLRAADYRYRLYLDLLVSVHDTPPQTWPLPPWDVALVLHAHMLAPIKFARDLSARAQYRGLRDTIRFPLQDLVSTVSGQAPSASRHLWEAHYSHLGIPYEVVTVSPTGPLGVLAVAAGGSPPPPLPALSLDLVAAVTRQIAFARKIAALYPYDPVPVALVADAQQRYGKFANLVREQAVASAVPALDIDWLWHTHQLAGPASYLTWCTKHLARPLDHDDTVAEGPLGDGLQATTAAWEAFYGEDYMNSAPGSGPTFENAGPSPQGSRPTLADKQPPRTLTPAQRALWQFDVRCQEEHQRIDCRYQQEVQTIGQYDRVLAKNGRRVAPVVTTEARGPPGATGATAAPLSSPPKKKSLLSSLASFGNPLANLEQNRGRAAVRAQQIQREARLAREMWGRERWPLLVAARGWGDANVTAGAWVRPSQGSAHLPFAVYPATWYDDKQLGYYSYIRGGRTPTGALTGESGGLVVGAGQCGGHFDGGNCVAAVRVAPKVYRGGDNVHGGGCAG